MSGNSSVEQELSFDSTLSSTNDSTRNDDGEAPKRPGSAYNLWAADNRRKVKADLANLYCGPWAVDSGPWTGSWASAGPRWMKPPTKYTTRWRRRRKPSIPWPCRTTLIYNHKKNIMTRKIPILITYIILFNWKPAKCKRKNLQFLRKSINTGGKQEIRQNCFLLRPVNMN